MRKHDLKYLNFCKQKLFLRNKIIKLTMRIATFKHNICNKELTYGFVRDLNVIKGVAI